MQQFLGQYETGVLTTPFESDLYFGKLSWQPAPGRELYATYHRRDEQEIRGFGGQRTRDGAESLEITTDALVGKHQCGLRQLRSTRPTAHLAAAASGARPRSTTRRRG